MLYSFLTAFALHLPVVSLYVHVDTWHGNWPIQDFLLFLVATVLTVVMHGASHVLGWRVSGRAPRDVLRFGVAHFYVDVSCEHPSSTWVHRCIVALSGVVPGILPCAGAFLTDGEIVFAFSLAPLSDATGDAVTHWRTRHLRRSAIVRDHGSRVGCVVLREGACAVEAT